MPRTIDSRLEAVERAAHRAAENVADRCPECRGHRVRYCLVGPRDPAPPDRGHCIICGRPAMVVGIRDPFHPDAPTSHGPTSAEGRGATP